MSAPEADPPALSPAQSLALVIKRRLVGLMVLLFAAFLLSTIVQRGTRKDADPDADAALKTIIVPIGGSTAAERAAEQIQP